MKCALTDAEVNHLRRLIGWARCEAGQSPDEIVETMKQIAPSIGPVSDEGKRRIVEYHEASANVPKYIRAAIKALSKAIQERGGDIVDAEQIGTPDLPARREMGSIGK